MKHILKIILGILFFLYSTFTIQYSSLQAADTGWIINNFDSQIVIHPDTSVSVTETIQVDFKGLQKHGIYRTIPVKYTTKYGNKLNIDLKLKGVFNQDDTPYQTKLERVGDSLKIRIGDPNSTLSGEQTYILHYNINQVITHPNELAELYFNVTGNDWPVPILRSKAFVTAPSDSIHNTICFKGYFGTGISDCTHGHNTTNATFTANFIEPGEGFTIATSLDPSALNFPTTTQKIIWFLKDNWFFFSPLITLTIMSYLYWTRGRDRRFKNIFHETGDTETVPFFETLNPLSVYSPPKDLTPGEVGTLIDETAHLSDITATIIDLARRGFFTIKEVPKKGFFGKTDYQLLHKTQDESTLHDFEISVLDMLFGSPRKDSVKLSKLPQNAYKNLESAQKKLYQHLTQTGYFTGNPQTVRMIYLIIGIITISISFFIGPIIGERLGIVATYFGFIISGLIIIAFSFFMPARTPKGRKALKEIVGLKEWIRLGAWREQIHEKHNFFEEVLPFAIAFGLTQKFIKAFKDAKLKNPDWYQSSHAFNAVHFSNSINSIGTTLNSGIASTRPKSSSSGGSGFSGGFSGGGFGGGGGGSW